MNKKSDNAIKTGVGFFGEISASISHEIKNSLAIMNENAGLLEDLSLMAKKGIALDPERVMLLSKKITKHVRIADQTVKNMNRFAHSTDKPITRVSINETLELLTALGQRYASSYGVTVELIASEKTAFIMSNPFELMNLFWMVMKYSFKHVGDDKKIYISTKNKESDFRIFFKNLTHFKNPKEENLLFEDDKVKKILENLNATVIINAGEGMIVVTLQDLEDS